MKRRGRSQRKWSAAHSCAVVSPASAHEPSNEFQGSDIDSPLKRNPALIQAYLEKYPNGEFGALAQILISQLTSESPSVIGPRRG